MEIPKKDFHSIINSFSKPINVTIPKNFPLTKKQKIEFLKVCKEQMHKYHYDKKEYQVVY